MFEGIKKFFGKKEVESKSYGQYDYDISGFTFFKDFISNKKISKTELLNLFTGYSYVCITATSEGIASLDRKLFWSENREDREKNHKYMDFITNYFLESVVAFLEITGICYIKINRFGNSIDSLEVLRTDFVTKNTNGTFNYNINGEIKIISEKDIFIIKNFSPFKDGLGFSPLEALGKQQKMDEAIIEWNWNFFKNGASSGTTLQTEQNLSVEQKEYLAHKWKSEFMGSGNAHKVAVLDNGLKETKGEIGQRDMDFVNQRTQIRDEIFTIFRVPKVVVGITDGVGYTDRMVGKSNFAEFKLKPIAQKIEEALNKHIFKGIGYFKFINIVPVDFEQLARDYQIGAITLDEYRIKRNYLNVKNGNRNISGEVFEYEKNGSYKEKKDIFGTPEILEKTIKNFLKENKENKNILSEENKEKRWQEKIKRTTEYEKNFKINLGKIFFLQEKEILKNLGKIFSKKSSQDLENIEEEDLFSEKAFLIIFMQYFYKNYEKILKNESKIANNEVGNSDLNFEKIEKYIGELIKKFALDINMTTRKQILEIIKNGYSEGIGYEEIKKNIAEKFEEYKKHRTEKIARTEITRAVNKARIETWKQNENVKYKEWYAPLDERGCDFCKGKHGQKKALSDSFGKNNYETLYGPPFHPNCRCDLVPILDYLE